MATESTFQNLAYLFRPMSGESPVRQRVESAWETSIFSSKSTSEQRFALLGRPSRNIKLDLWANGHTERLLLNRWLARWASQRQYIPLFADQSVLGAEAAAAQKVLTVDTTYRRFQVGRKVVVYQPALGTGVGSVFEVGTIDTMNTTSITLLVNLAITFAAGSIVVPLVESELYFESEYNDETYYESSASFEALEVVGSNSLAPLVTPGSAPAGYTLYGGYPILDVVPSLAYNSSAGWRRQGGLISSGQGTFPRILGTRPSASYELPLEFNSRAAAWSYLTFAESRGGRTYPFWVAPPTLSYTLDSVVGGGTGIKVAQLGEEADWAFHPTIGVRLLDGTLYIRAISSVTRAAGLDELTFDTGIGSLTAEAIERVGPAALVRYDLDVTKEEWITTDVLRTTASLIELPVEENITVANLVDLTTADLDLVFDSIECYRCCGCTTGSACQFSEYSTITVYYTSYFCQDLSNEDCSVLYPMWSFFNVTTATLTWLSCESGYVYFQGTATTDEYSHFGSCGSTASLNATNDATMDVRWSCNDVQWEVKGVAIWGAAAPAASHSCSGFSNIVDTCTPGTGNSTYHYSKYSFVVNGNSGCDMP